jgi:hypothetical protein
MITRKLSMASAMAIAAAIGHIAATKMANGMR